MNDPLPCSNLFPPREPRDDQPPVPSLDRRAFTRLTVGIVAGASLPSPRVKMSAFDGRGHEESLQSELLLDLTLEAASPRQLGTASSGRLIVPVTGGTFSGPRLRGTIVPPGGDWITQRADGVRLLDVRLVFETDDKEILYVSWRGIAFTPPGGSLFARIVPVFETGSEKYAWLNRVVAVGVYRPGAALIAYRVYSIL